MFKKSEKCFGILFVLFLIFLLPVVRAACSIGANPLSMEARAIPGQTIEATWNLYNLYGDRTTHVKINVVEGPDWEITFEPVLHKAIYNVTGVMQTIEENVAIEQSSVVTIKPEIIPEGVDYVKHPNEEGYIPVKTIKIYIKVPENTELWKDYNFVFEALGNCFMEPGAVVPAIATQLEINVKTVSEEFYEEPAKKPLKVDIDFSNIIETLVKAEQGSVKAFTLDGITIHKITFKEITADSVTLLIESSPVEVTLKIGETKEVDINADGINDLEIKLNKIIEGIAELRIKKIEGAELSKPGIVGMAIKQIGKTTTTTTLLLILIILLIILLLTRKKR